MRITSRTIIESAIDVLNARGWCQDSAVTWDGRHCLVGAVEYAGAPQDQEVEVFLCIARVLQRDKRWGYSIALWNDQPGRTKDEVIDLLKDVYAELPLWRPGDRG